MLERDGGTFPGPGLSLIGPPALFPAVSSALSAAGSPALSPGRDPR
jgi:hypothetical protein